MTMEDLRDAVHQAPFQPFTIHLSDGHTIYVPHPDFVALSGGGLSAVVTSLTTNGFTVVDVSLITRLEVPAVPKTRRPRT
jgi:hypothetical protein